MTFDACSRRSSLMLGGQVQFKAEAVVDVFDVVVEHIMFLYHSLYIITIVLHSSCCVTMLQSLHQLLQCNNDSTSINFS